MDFHVYLQQLMQWGIKSGSHIVITLILAFISLKLSKKLSEHFIALMVKQKEDPEFQKRTQTLGSIIRYAFVITILIVTAIIVISEFGIEIGPIIAAAGIVGLAVGFGAQSLVKDVITGFFILSRVLRETMS